MDREIKNLEDLLLSFTTKPIYAEEDGRLIHLTELKEAQMLLSMIKDQYHRPLNLSVHDMEDRAQRGTFDG